ncbi:MAG TPA: DHH family phosphoesterase [Deltaproteobacteria bacterium]|nr:DHH family phosphoesterase [Deltaproteobacteria bacterium]HPJ94602.1 DHH family phosphoesterase [Deltaproteobacteria bacterium]HPR52616.1 DHH family phosphoesterase [Deltaproteobacteria bacterium]
MNRLHEFIAEHRRAAVLFMKTAQKERLPMTVVHHNDADGIAAGAILSHALSIAGLDFRLLPVEKVHEPIISKVHADSGSIIVYADLGGQSSGMIGRYSFDNPLVIILDHHLPGGDVPANVVHLNVERFGISGDDDASGASVCAIFARELLREAPLLSAHDEGLPSLLGVLGAIGDGQDQKGSLTGINLMLLETALSQGELIKSPDGFTIPRYMNRTAREVVEMLNLLGSIGFYSGSAQTGVDFLLGEDQDRAFQVCGQLEEMKTSLFTRETQAIRTQRLTETKHVQWVDVQDRFSPMGVKAIGLFLEHLIHEGLAAPEKYLIGFQHLPAEMPGIGTLKQSLTKISARVTAELKKSIQLGDLPDFMTLIPRATALVSGTADGCHRFTAASVIQQGQEEEFITSMETVLDQTRKNRSE